VPDSPEPPADPWVVPAQPPGQRPPRSTGYKVVLGLTVTICVFMGLFIVAGAVLVIALSNSSGFANK
jgi:hypothetical protein